MNLKLDNIMLEYSTSLILLVKQFLAKEISFPEYTMQMDANRTLYVKKLENIYQETVNEAMKGVIYGSDTQ